MSVLFGVATFLLNFIPNVGPAMAMLLPLPMVIFDPNSTTATFVLALVLPGSVHAIVGNMIEPKVFGDQLEVRKHEANRTH
jgi:AI-2 transport protein TqsA